MGGLCAALPVSCSGSVNQGETLSGGSTLHRYCRWVHVSVGAGNTHIFFFNLRLAGRKTAKEKFENFATLWAAKKSLAPF